MLCAAPRRGLIRALAGCLEVGRRLKPGSGVEKHVEESAVAALMFGPDLNLRRCYLRALRDA